MITDLRCLEGLNQSHNALKAVVGIFSFLARIIYVYLHATCETLRGRCLDQWSHCGVQAHFFFF